MSQILSLLNIHHLSRFSNTACVSKHVDGVRVHTLLSVDAYERQRTLTVSSSGTIHTVGWDRTTHLAGREWARLVEQWTGGSWGSPWLCIPDVRITGPKHHHTWFFLTSVLRIESLSLFSKGKYLVKDSYFLSPTLIFLRNWNFSVTSACDFWQCS